ncbi:hypothetical protein [Azospirillum endophyticum]
MTGQLVENEGVDAFQCRRRNEFIDIKRTRSVWYFINQENLKIINRNIAQTITSMIHVYSNIIDAVITLIFSHALNAYYRDSIL